MGIARSSLYYVPKIHANDLILKARIEASWEKHAAYGRNSLAIHLSVNHKRMPRVMRLFSLKVPRAVKLPTKLRDAGKLPSLYPNLIKALCPVALSVVWTGDFTRTPFHGKFLYLTTVIDIYTREILGKNILTVHTVTLIKGSSVDAKNRSGYLPLYHHSDQGIE